MNYALPAATPVKGLPEEKEVGRAQQSSEFGRQYRSNDGTGHSSSCQFRTSNDHTQEGLHQHHNVPKRGESSSHDGAGQGILARRLQTVGPTTAEASQQRSQEVDDRSKVKKREHFPRSKQRFKLHPP